MLWTATRRHELLSYFCYTGPPAATHTAWYSVAKNNDRVLVDNHGRVINYLRLAVTDRCNLRCFYCMPEHGLNWLSRQELMTFPEMLRLSALLVSMGVEKIRITGGEPFVRKGVMPFLHSLAALPGLRQINITTNGVLTAPLVPELQQLGIRSVNLSLDTLDRARFAAITHRDELPAVLQTMDALLAHGIEVKINAVVMDGRNTQDILPLVQLTRHLPVSVRFIEEMPFNGGDRHYTTLQWHHARILQEIKAAYPTLEKIPDPPYATAAHYHIPGHAGTIGIIAAYTRSFCGTCNRIRITPQGMLKTCLYDGGVLSIKDLLRTGISDADLTIALLNALAHRPKDGWAAENTASHESMAAIGG